MHWLTSVYDIVGQVILCVHIIQIHVEYPSHLTQS